MKSFRDSARLNFFSSDDEWEREIDDDSDLRCHRVTNTVTSSRSNAHHPWRHKFNCDDSNKSREFQLERIYLMRSSKRKKKNSFFADPTFFYFYGALMIIYYLLVWVHMSAVEGRSVLRWRLQVPCGIQRQPLQDASMLHRPLQCGTPEPPRQQTGCSRSGPGEKTGYLQNEQQQQPQQQQQQQLQKSQPICWARLK